MPSHTRALRALRRGLVATVALGFVAATTAAAPAGASVPSASSAPRASLALAAQTSWVRGPSGLDLRLRVESSLPAADLGLRFVLYSRLTSRSAFEQSLTGTEATSELPIDTPPTIPLRSIERRASASGLVTVHFPVSTAPVAPTRRATSPTLALDCGDQCDGVYPLQAVLVDSADDAILSSFTTHVVYTVGTSGALPLRVSLVLPAGTQVALGPDGSSLLTSSRLARLGRLLRTVASAPAVAVTLECYPQLVVALESDRSRQARSLLSTLVAQFGARAGAPPATRELLGTTFTPVDVAALSAAHLSGELDLQLLRGEEALGARLGLPEGPNPYVADAPIGQSALAMLEAAGVRDLVLPTDAVSVTPGTPQPTVALTSPVGLVPPRAGSSGAGDGSGNAGGTVSRGTPAATALVSDPGLASHFAGGSASAVLRAHQLLADLAEIYFDAPSDRAPRGVVVAPVSWAPDATFLSTVLSGLATSPVLTSRTLADAFAQLPVGGNGAPRVEQLAAPSVRSAHPLPEGPVVNARRSLAVLASVLPDDHALLAHLSDSILLSETPGLSATSRRRYVGAPRTAYRLIDGALSISGGRTVTLTSRTGQIPVTIVSTSPYPIHALVEVRDSALSFPDGAGPLAVTFTTKTTAREYKVTTRTSGASRLDVVVRSPVGGVVLLSGAFTIRSTAVSGVAVTLSIGALLVLLVWWLRSVRRHRRRAAAARAAGVPDAPAPA